MFLILVILFIVGPIAEIYVLLAAGSNFGVLPVIAACIGTAIAGGAIIRWQGIQALDAARRDLGAGKPPVQAVIDGALLVVAAPFLMTPGFITDALGFSLLIPPVRHFLARYALKQIEKRVKSGDAKVTIYRP